MASKSTERIALLSIHPRFAQLIMNGKKRAEFRKRNFRENVSHVVVYATSPVRKILGYFEVSYIDEDLPKRLWDRYRKVGGIQRREFQEYYASTACGVAIGIGQICPLAEPIPLSNLDDSISVPQNFAYISSEAFEKLQRQH